MTRRIHGSMLTAFGGSLALIALVMACTPPAPASPTTPPAGATVQAAGTQITGAVGAVATVAQTAVVQPTVSSAQTQVATSVAAAGTSVVAAGATVQTQATGVSVAREATASALAPTAQAVATHVAPTVQAAATQAVAGAATSVASSPVRVTSVMVNPNDTSVAVQNSGSAAVNLNGWTLLMGPSMSVMLGEIMLSPGQTRTLHFSQGADTTSDVYLGLGSTAATASLTPGTRVVLVAPTDQIASVYPIL